MQTTINRPLGNSTQGFSRAQTWHALQSQSVWDVCVIGGGATGLGTALDAAARGYSVVLVEAQDFASGASSRSSKMLHGGVRYLQQLDFALVKEALNERATVMANAPHVAKTLPFVIPCDSWSQAAYYGSGLKMYDLLAGQRNLARSHYLSCEEVASQASALKSYAHGIQYYDGLFDDARLAQSLARSARLSGAVLFNYCRAESSGSADDGANLIKLSRQDASDQFTLRARCTIFATGAWSGERVAVSRGSHVVVPDVGLKSGILLPKTSDGRVLYMLPWLGRTLIGTTDISVTHPDYEDRAPQEDIDWLLRTASHALHQSLETAQVTASFVGYRPLVRPSGKLRHSSQFSRVHLVERIADKALHVVGGKWTTYRRMAQDVLDTAIADGLLPRAKDCSTFKLALAANPMLDNAWQSQGDWSDAQFINLVKNAIHEEAAVTADDILYRRLRVGFTDESLTYKLRDKVTHIIHSLEVNQKQLNLHAS